MYTIDSSPSILISCVQLNMIVLNLTISLHMIVFLSGLYHNIILISLRFYLHTSFLRFLFQLYTKALRTELLHTIIRMHDHLISVHNKKSCKYDCSPNTPSAASYCPRLSKQKGTRYPEQWSFYFIFLLTHSYITSKCRPLRSCILQLCL